MQSPEFHMNFELLQKQYSENPESFKTLHKLDVLRLIQMQETFNTGVYSPFKGHSIDFSSIIAPIMANVPQKHKDLVLAIYKNKEQTLEPYMGPVEDACPEYPILYGNIDLMARNGDCAYIIEVKTDPANHAIVGQVMKYYIGMCLQLSLKFFRDVKIITICPGYDQAACNGLRQIGATMLLIDPVTLKVGPVP